jgi:lysophospholipase L1-like esterase
MKIVCLGDSLTYGFGVHRGEDWVSLTAGATGRELVNRGVCGDTTGGMLARFQKDVLAAKPEAVLLMGGANDILTSGTDAAARSNMSAMIQQADSAGVIPVVGIQIPFDPEHVRADWSELTDFSEANRILSAYGDWLRKYCGIFHIPTVDFAALFKNAGSGASALYWDGLHPNAKGHAAMAELAGRRLEALGLGRDGTEEELQ